MNKIASMLHTAALSLLLIGGAHATTSKTATANKAAVVAASSTTSKAGSTKSRSTRTASSKTASTKSASTKSSHSKPMMKVNINSADADAIRQALINIGPSKAAAIVAYRKQHGAFHTADELASVKGVGLKTIEKNRDRILVSGVASAATSTAKHTTAKR